MAAPKGNQNSVGNSGGKSLNDRILAAEVRNLTLNKIKALLEMPEVKMKTDDYELYKAVLIKLAGSVLPRLNEHTGQDGGPIEVDSPYTDDQRKKVAKRILERGRTPGAGGPEPSN